MRGTLHLAFYNAINSSNKQRSLKPRRMINGILLEIIGTIITEREGQSL